MEIVSIDKIDGWGGNVISGIPVEGDLVRITFSNGGVQERIFRVPVPKPDILRVYIHIDITGPVVNNIVSIPNDGTTPAHIRLVLRGTTNPEEDRLNYNKLWAFPMRDSDGLVYDYLGIKFVAGIAELEYTATKPGMITVDNSDVDDVIGSSIITLATKPQLLVYRNFV